MAKTITELAELAEAPASDDWFVVVDVSVAETKKVAASNVGGGGTPTLAEVLVAGNDPNGTVIQGATLVLSEGARVDVGAAGVGGEAGFLGLYGGYGGDSPGGTVGIAAGVGSGAGLGAGLDLYGGNVDAHGKVRLRAAGSRGGAGDVFASDGEFAGWQSVLTSGSGAPGATFVSLLYLDTTAVTGGCYAWDGAAYTKIAGAL